MEDLGISRGNANTNLRELVGWGLIKSVIRKGERKEFFEAEKDIWEMATIIARERKRRELDPAIAVVRDCKEMVKGEKGAAADFYKQMTELEEFMKLGSNLFEKVSGKGRSNILKLAATLLK